MKHLSFLLFLLFHCIGYGQCLDDRHNTSLEASWISCEFSASPNPIRGDAHWIAYDLGEVKKLTESRIWNINNPSALEDGVRQLAIDYSVDGINWEVWGIWDVPMAEGSGFYTGIEGPDLEGLEARHILLTVLNNHGGNCSGFGEIRFGVEKSSSTSDAIAHNSRLSASPNPAFEMTLLRWTSDLAGEANLRFIDMEGRIITQDKIQLIGGEQELQYNLDQIETSGQYIIKLSTGKKEWTTELSIIKSK